MDIKAIETEYNRIIWGAHEYRKINHRNRKGFTKDIVVVRRRHPVYLGVSERDQRNQSTQARV